MQPNYQAVYHPASVQVHSMPANAKTKYNGRVIQSYARVTESAI